MRVGLIVDPFGEKTPGGLGRSIFEMVKALLTEDTEDEFIVYVKQVPTDKPAFPHGKWRLVPLNVRQLFLSAARRIDRSLDAYIFYTPIIPIFFFPRRSIVIAYDFAYLELPGRSLRQKISAQLLRLAHAISFAKATHIVAISEATRQSAFKHFSIDPKKITTMHIGFVPLGATPTLVAVPPKFFLFAGVLKERKNVSGVIRAFAEFTKHSSGQQLLVAGKVGGAYYESLVRLVKELGITERVQFLGYVTDEELAYLYDKAEALVFPSFIEGFGMPVLEAMHAGLPVITSKFGALAEVAGDAALLVDPHNPNEIAEAMCR